MDNHEILKIPVNSPALVALYVRSLYSGIGLILYEFAFKKDGVGGGCSGKNTDQSHNPDHLKRDRPLGKQLKRL